MRKLVLILVLAPGIALAQSNAGMSEDMAKMMMQAQKAQACMQDIDQSQFEKIQKDGKEMEAKLQKLCDSGKRDEAQEKALAFSREMMKSPAMAKVQECSEHLRGLMPEMPFDNFEEEMANKNICDEMK